MLPVQSVIHYFKYI